MMIDDIDDEFDDDSMPSAGADPSLLDTGNATPLDFGADGADPSPLDDGVYRVPSDPIDPGTASLEVPDDDQTPPPAAPVPAAPATIGDDSWPPDLSDSDLRRYGFYGGVLDGIDRHQQAYGRPPTDDELLDIGRSMADFHGIPLHEALGLDADQIAPAAPNIAATGTAPVATDPTTIPVAAPAGGTNIATGAAGATGTGDATAATTPPPATPPAGDTGGAPDGGTPAPAAPPADAAPAGSGDGTPDGGTTAPPAPNPAPSSGGDGPPDGGTTSPPAATPPAGAGTPPPGGATNQPGKRYVSPYSPSQILGKADKSHYVSSGPDTGSHQCVALVKAAVPDIGPTSQWRQGPRITGPGDPNLQPGTAIATGWAQDGTYPSNNTGNHAAIVDHVDPDGTVWVIDRYDHRDANGNGHFREAQSRILTPVELGLYSIITH